MEDLVNEIYSVGPAFKQASNFLWPFKLSSARKLTARGTNVHYGAIRDEVYLLGHCRMLLPSALPQQLIQLVSFLLAAVGGMDKKRVHYVEGGQAGNREDKINNLIQRMN